MNCLWAITAEPANAQGILYRCVVCGRGYRSWRSPERIVQPCTGTAGQWAAVRRQRAVDAVRAGVPAERLEAAMEQVERCLACGDYLEGCCRRYTCGERWVGVVARGKCVLPSGPPAS